MLDRIWKAREAGEVQRFHTSPLNLPENVATHSFNVVNLVLIITGGAARRELILAAFMHDMGERITGDIPSPAKAAMDDRTKMQLERVELEAVCEVHGTEYTDKLHITERRLVTMCDNLDGLLKCVDELKRGNIKALEIAKRYVNYIERGLELWKLEPLHRDAIVQILAEIMGVVHEQSK